MPDNLDALLVDAIVSAKREETETEYLASCQDQLREYICLDDSNGILVISLSEIP
jgi:hypothetical protein